MWKKRNKYGAKKIEIDGIIFASRKEGARYSDLKLLLKAGKISNLQLQVKFPIVVEGKKICIYIADFTYWELPLLPVIEDVKGLRTAIFNLKWKLMQAMYPKNTFRIT